MRQQRINMKDWIIPGLYVLVYLDKRAQEFDIIHHINMQRPFVVSPELKGNSWNYLRRKINGINTVGLNELTKFSMKEFHTSSGPLALHVTPPNSRPRPNLTPLVELVAAHAFIPKENEETSEAAEIAGDLVEKIGFDRNDFHAEIFNVDFGTAGLHQYCLFGGFNKYVYNNLKQENSNLSFMEKLLTIMNQQWHEKLACYLGIILWSKIKVSPLLRATLIDDSLAFESVKRKREVETGFQMMVKRALMAYARNPL